MCWNLFVGWENRNRRSCTGIREKPAIFLDFGVQMLNGELRLPGTPSLVFVFYVLVLLPWLALRSTRRLRQNPQLLDDLRVRRNLEAAHRHLAHRLDAAGHNHVRLTCDDPFGGLRDRLQPGAAESVDGHCRDRHRQSRAQGRDAGDVHALWPLGHGAPEDHVFDLRRGQCRHPRERAGSIATELAHDAGDVPRRGVLGLADHLVLPVSHTGMLISATVARQCLAFLRRGRFDHA